MRLAWAGRARAARIPRIPPFARAASWAVAPAFTRIALALKIGIAVALLLPFLEPVGKKLQVKLLGLIAHVFGRL
jgi:hypothetical protein